MSKKLDISLLKGRCLIYKQTKQTKIMYKEQVKSMEFFKNDEIKKVTLRCGKVTSYRKDGSIKTISHDPRKNPFTLVFNKQ